MRLLGYGKTPALEIKDVVANPSTLRLGDAVTLQFAIKSKSKSPQELLVDVGLHFVKANGQTAPKVFKLKRITLGPGTSVTLQQTVSFAEMTTRKHYPGTHRWDVRVNGAVFEAGKFEVTRPRVPQSRASNKEGKMRGR